MDTFWNEISERYEITNEMLSNFDSTRILGHAYKRYIDDFYHVKLRVLPNTVYYLKKDTDSDSYALYAKSSVMNGKRRLYDSVGTGYEVATGFYIKVNMPDLNLCFYLRLSPKDYHHDLKIS